MAREEKELRRLEMLEDDDFDGDDRDLFVPTVEEKYYEMAVENVAFDIEFPDRFR